MLHNLAEKYTGYILHYSEGHCLSSSWHSQGKMLDNVVNVMHFSPIEVFQDFAEKTEHVLF